MNCFCKVIPVLLFKVSVRKDFTNVHKKCGAGQEWLKVTSWNSKHQVKSMHDPVFKIKSLVKCGKFCVDAAMQLG